MASPWKFLERLTSRWQERKEAPDGLTDDVKSDEATSPEPVEVATDNAPNSNDRLVEGEPQPAYRADAGMIVSEHSAAGSSVQVKVGPESALDATGPALSGGGDFTATSTRDARTSAPSKNRPNAKRKRSQEASVTKSVENFPKLPTSAPTFPDEVQSLDEEIRLLRDQLARKLNCKMHT